MKSIFATVFLIFTTCCATAQKIPSASPKHEVRAVWLTTIGGLDWPHSYAQTPRSVARQQNELRQTLDRLRRAGINTVLIQTRIRATTLYPSALEPWDGCLSGFPGKSPGYDALQFAIDECHKRGMELHAWVVTIPVGRWNATGCQRLRAKHPRLLKRIGDEGFMNPELPETADYLADLCSEIVSNYDVDGIHLDYIRYPETWKQKVNPATGRTHITRIVSRISHTVHRLKPWVKMSCSPIGKREDLTRYWSHGWNARQTACQDPDQWLADGLMDQLYPMMYFRGDQFFPFALDWQEQSHGKTIVPGLGIYFLSPKEKDWPLTDIEREMRVSRTEGMGHAYFRSKFLTDNVKGLYNLASLDIDARPSLIPPMTWADEPAPEAPEDLQVTHTAWGDSLVWTPSVTRGNSPNLLYNVYASAEGEPDTADASQLIVIRRKETYLRVPTGGRLMHYAVTATDRYAQESGPTYCHTPLHNSQDKQLSSQDTQLLRTATGSIELPQRSSTTDADVLAVTDLTGRLVQTLRWTTRPNLSTLPDGMYILHIMDKKGVTHRIAWMMKRKR